MSIEKVEAELIKDVPAIAGYEILSVAGSGGMSVVFKAKQTALGRIVAIKMLHKHLVTGALTLQRFMQEARLTTELKHANVADVFACGLTSDEQPFIAMEFLEGKSLRDLIHEKGALDPHEIRTLFEGILAGLTAAHQAGIVHRDLKPANVVLSKDQSGRTVPKIVDFGVAKIAAIPKGEYQRLTQTGAVVGSPAYMSPEQCTGVSIDARADIYSLGCMLFEALTGQVPFDSDNLFELMSKQLDATPPAPSTVASTEIPKAFDTITAKCLAKDPAQRYQNCYQLLKALSAVDMTQMAAVSHHQARRNTKPLKRNLWVVKITAVVLGVGLPAVIAWNWNSYSRRMNDVHALEAAVKAYDLAAASSMASRLANLKGLPDRAKVSVVESEYWLARALRDHGKKDQADDVLLLLDGQAEQCADAKYFALCMRLLDEKIAPHDRAPQLKAIERETSLLDSGYTKAPVYYWLAQNRGKEIAGDFYEKAVAAAMASNRTVHELHYRAIQGKAQAVWSEPEGYARNVRLLTDRKKNLVEDDTYESILALDRFASMAQAARDHELRWWCTDELYRKLQRNPNLPILAKGKILYLKGAQEQDKGRWSQSIPLFEQTIHTLERDFPDDDNLAASYERIGRALDVSNQYDKAVAYFSRSMHNYNRPPRVHMQEEIVLRSHLLKRAEELKDKRVAEQYRAVVAEADKQLDSMLASPTQYARFVKASSDFVAEYTGRKEYRMAELGVLRWLKAEQARQEDYPGQPRLAGAELKKVREQQRITNASR